MRTLFQWADGGGTLKEGLELILVLSSWTFLTSSVKWDNSDNFLLALPWDEMSYYIRSKHLIKIVTLMNVIRKTSVQGGYESLKALYGFKGLI